MAAGEGNAKALNGPCNRNRHRAASAPVVARSQLAFVNQLAAWFSHSMWLVLSRSVATPCCQL